MAGGEPTRDFEGHFLKKNDSKEIIIRFSLTGFKPKDVSHSCFAKVSPNNALIVNAIMGGEKYEHVIDKIDLDDKNVSSKGKENAIDVIINRPKGYSIEGRL